MDKPTPICYTGTALGATRARRMARCSGPRYSQTQNWRFASVQVHVRDNNVDQALKALKKKMQREGIFREMKLRNYYEKPSEKRAREKAEAVRRARKLARKRAQREGLIPSRRRGR
jgi:small subunit ribosomal protein S21